jgi:hypothetical protein
MRVAALAVTALVVPACAGGSDQPRTYTGADADRIAHVAPETPGMEWPADPVFDPYVEDVGPPPKTDDPALAEFFERTKRLDWLGDAGSRWETGDNLANLGVELWASEADAQAAMAPYRSVLRVWNKRAGTLALDEDVDGLGDEAWRIGDTRGMTYKWRRRNLVVEAYVGCLDCPRDLDESTRAWVDAIDEEARADS